MGTATSLPPNVETKPGAALPGEAAGEQALVQRPPECDNAPLPVTGPAVRLPVELDVMVPLRQFRVRNLLTLEPGTVVCSQWGHGDDVPVCAGDVQLAWAEFEVVDTELAVRLTRLV